MSSGGKRLTTSQKVFTRYQRVERISDDIIDLNNDLERVAKKLVSRYEKKVVREATAMLLKAQLMLVDVQNSLDSIMDDS
jgi:hypothetical protein